MSLISDLHARQILDSRGNPTVEVDCITEEGVVGRAAVPSGASTGTREALELRDGETNYYKGKSVDRAVVNVNDEIAVRLCDMSVFEQRECDMMMIDLDGTENKGNLGANAILACSMAIARAAAATLNMPLYRYLGGAMANRLPAPLMNVINGGAHADNNLDIQEFMIVPAGAPNFESAVRMGTEIYHTLKSILKKQGLSTAIGDEGGFAPNLKNHEEALQVLVQAIKDAGYEPGKDCFLALDVAASELYENGKYSFEGKQMSFTELNSWYEAMIAKYPIISLRTAWRNRTRMAGFTIQTRLATRFSLSVTMFL